jgi:protein gp37
MAQRLKGRAGYPQDEPFRVTFHPDRVETPLHWRKPKRVFVCSMGDLFHEDVPAEAYDRIFDVMQDTPRHTYQLLTKRPLRMATVLEHDWGGLLEGLNELPTNVWLGVTAENQEWADKRIPVLLEIPAAVRFVSLEPLLGPITLRRLDLGPELVLNALDGQSMHHLMNGYGLLDWVIVGGESGPGARPMHPQWVRNIRDQCVAAGVPFFFKGWGAWLRPDQRRDWRTEPISAARTHQWPDDTVSYRIGKKAAGRMLDGREWSEFPEAKENAT